jgi:FolB domain-containing protein
MADRIDIVDLHLRALVGINDEERDKLQDVVLNLVLWCDHRAAGASDDIADAVNYRTITKEVIELVDRKSFDLLERVVTVVAETALAHDGVERVQVSAEKPGALRFAKTVRVTIERDRT